MPELTGWPITDKPDERRLRLVSITFAVLAGLLQLDGTFALKMEGWPDGAKVVAADVDNISGRIDLYLHHPDFDPVPEGVYIGEPILITATRSTDLFPLSRYSLA